MEVNKDLAIDLWKEVFGDKVWATDCFGSWINKNDYGDIEKMRTRPGNSKAYNYGWDIDHIYPSSKNGKDHRNNYEPMHHINNRDNKKDNLNFKVEETSYQVVRCEICQNHNVYGYGIKNQSTGERVDWKGVQRRYYNE